MLSVTLFTSVHCNCIKMIGWCTADIQNIQGLMFQVITLLQRETRNDLRNWCINWFILSCDNWLIFCHLIISLLLVPFFNSFSISFREGPSNEMLDLVFRISTVHQPFYISIRISILQHILFINCTIKC